MKTLLFALLCCVSLPMMAAVGMVVPREAFPKVDLNGAPLTGLESEDLCVVECWATWCGPCVKAMPHMESLWQQMKGEGMRFVGLNVGDWKSPEALKKFLANLPTPPTYPIAVDKGELFTKAVGLKGIPRVFLLSKGRVVWNGHPTQLDVETLKRKVREVRSPSTPPKPQMLTHPHPEPQKPMPRPPMSPERKPQPPRHHP